MPSVLPVWASFSSVDYYHQLLRQVSTDLDKRGLNHLVNGADAVTVTIEDLPARLDLRALAAVVAAQPVREWERLIGEQVDQMVARARSAVQFTREARPLEEVRTLLALRMVNESSPTATTWPLAGTLAARLAYALPETVADVPEDHPGRWDLDRAALHALALANTRTLVRPIVAESHETQRRYDVLANANPLAASVLLCMDEIVGPLTPYGVLVGVPSVHEMVAHVITNADGAHETLEELPTALGRRFARVPEPLSDQVYWWRAGEVMGVPVVEDRAEPPTPLGEILSTLPA